MALFIESRAFRQRVGEFLTDDELAAAQRELADHPERWPVIPGSGGARKARVAQSGRGRGKWGGARIVYVYLPRREHIHLLVIYGKKEVADLSPSQLATVRRAVKEIYAAARGSDE